MAGNLTAADSLFSTALIFPEQGEVLAAACASGLANNTGFLRYRRVPWCAFELEVAGTALETASVTYYAYMTAGTYEVWGGVRLPSLTSIHGTLTFDGTVIFAGAYTTSDGTRDSAQVIIAADAWVAIKGSATIVDPEDDPSVFHFYGDWRALP
jgi:hypothetical protein